MNQGTFRRTSLALAFTLAALFLPRAAGAHCDTMDGPVVTAGLKALETGNVGLALVWVREPDETAVREAFRSAVAVRALGAEAKKMADMYYFPDRFSTLYAYERNPGNPHGHRNLLFTHRNYPITPFFQTIDEKFMLPDTPDGVTVATSVTSS